MRIRSTQQYVETPFRPGSGKREARLDYLNKGLKYQIVAPEEYCDQYKNHLMDTPCDIRIRTTMQKEFVVEELPDGSMKGEWKPVVGEDGKVIETTFVTPPCYVDANARYRYETHPSGNTDIPWQANWSNGVYVENVALAQEIEAWLRIEELKKYVKDLEKARDDALKTEVPEIRGPKREKIFRLFSTSVNVLQNSGRSEEAIPKEFTSDFSGKLMTLPVRVNGKDIIDFKELFITEDDTLNAASFESIMDGYRTYCKEDLSNLQFSCEQDFSHLDTLSEDSLSLEEKTRIIEEARARFREDYKKRFTLVAKDTVKSLPLEEYAVHFNITELIKILPKYRKYYDQQYSIVSGEIQRAKRRIENAKQELAEMLAQLKHVMKSTHSTEESESIFSQIQKTVESFAYQESKLIDDANDSDEESTSSNMRKYLTEKVDMINAIITIETQKLDDSYVAKDESIKLDDRIKSINENIKEIIERVAQEVKRIIDLKPVDKSFANKNTFEWWIKYVYIAESRTYVNPCDNQAITSIEVEQGLLARLDDWLDPLKEQVRTLEKHVADYSASMEWGFKTNYADIMRPHLEKDSVPNISKCQHLTPSLIPGSREVEFATHPVLLDGAYVIDYGRLKTYWDSKGVIGWMINWVYPMNWFGYNPFTGRLCQTLEYMHPLKQETDQYMKTVWCAQLFKSVKASENNKLLLEQHMDKHMVESMSLKQKF